MAHWIRFDIKTGYDHTLVIDLEKATHFTFSTAFAGANGTDPVSLIRVHYGECEIIVDERAHPNAYKNALQYITDLTD